MNSLNDLWKRFEDCLFCNLSETTLDTWFDELSIVALEDMAVVLYCPNEFKRNVLQKHFLPQLQEAAKMLFTRDMFIKILGDEQLSAYHGVRPDHPEGDESDLAFTFDTFVAGPQNKLAYAAAMSVANKPAGSYNPLLIYGDSGLGKTHLLYAIRHQTLQLYPDFKIVYIKGDEFINEFIELVRAGRGDEFRAKYRDADMLLVDDIQFVAGKEQVQNEFFHTFNTLHESGKQIVLTSDRPPKDMTLLDDRLRTRFEWGLMADITPPDYETRLAIIRNKASMLGILLEADRMDRIANNFTANVRQIEGVLNKLLAYQDLLGRAPTDEQFDKFMSDYVNDVNSYITPAYIIKKVAEFYTIEEDVMRGPDRRKDAVIPRQVAMYLMRRMIASMSLKDIGREFDNRDHSTVLNSLERMEKQMRINSGIAEDVKEITTNINFHK